jgi:anti-sigma B factor antagonist
VVDQFPGDTFGGCGNWQSGGRVVRRVPVVRDRWSGPVRDIAEDSRNDPDGESGPMSSAWCRDGNEDPTSHASRRDEITQLGEPGEMATVGYHWEKADVLVLTISGEVDMSNVEALRERLATILQPGTRNVVFDLGGLEFIDSSGLAVLVDVANHVGGAKLRAPSRLVGRVVDVTGLGDLLPIEQ